MESTQTLLVAVATGALGVAFGWLYQRRRFVQTIASQEYEWRSKLVLATRKIQTVVMAFSQDLVVIRALLGRLERVEPMVGRLGEELSLTREHVQRLENGLLEQSGKIDELLGASPLLGSERTLAVAATPAAIGGGGEAEAELAAGEVFAELERQGAELETAVSSLVEGEDEAPPRGNVDASEAREPHIEELEREIAGWLRRYQDLQRSDLEALEDAGRRLERSEEARIELERGTGERIEGLERELEERKTRLGAAERRCGKLQRERDECLESLGETKEERDTLRIKLEMLEGELADLNERHEALERAKQELSDSAVERDEKLAELESRILELGESLAEERRSSGERLEEIRTVRDELTSREEELAASAEQIRRLERDVEEATTARASLEGAVAELEAEAARLEERAEGLKESLGEAEEHLRGRETELDERRAEIERLEALESDQRAEIERMAGRVEELEGETGRLETDLGEAERRFDDARKERSRLLESLQRYDHRASDTSEALLELQLEIQEEGRSLEQKAGKLLDLMRFLNVEAPADESDESAGGDGPAADPG